MHGSFPIHQFDAGGRCEDDHSVHRHEFINTGWGQIYLDICVASRFLKQSFLDPSAIFNLVPTKVAKVIQVFFKFGDIIAVAQADKELAAAAEFQNIIILPLVFSAAGVLPDDVLRFSKQALDLPLHISNL